MDPVIDIFFSRNFVICRCPKCEKFEYERIQSTDLGSKRIKTGSISVINRPSFDMYATWCPPCKKLSPILEEIQKEYGDKLQIYKVDVDKEPALAQLFNASSIPLMLFIPENGKPFTVTGLRPKEQITDIINEKLEVKK